MRYTVRSGFCCGHGYGDVDAGDVVELDPRIALSNVRLGRLVEAGEPPESSNTGTATAVTDSPKARGRAQKGT
jgi:hypothetical protein